MRRASGVRRIALLLAVFALAASCGQTTTADKLESSDDTAGEPTSTADEDTGRAPEVTENTVLEDESSDEVVLVDAGAEPCRELRYRFSATGLQQSTATVSLLVTETRDGYESTHSSRGVPLQVSTEQTCEVLEVDDEGSARIAFDAGAQTVDNDEVVNRGMSHDFTLAWEPTGSSYFVTWTSRGEVIDFAEADAAPKALSRGTAAKGQALVSQGITLPVEPIGVGGSWRVTTQVETFGGVAAEQTSTYTLRSVDEDVITVDLTLSQELAEAGDIAWGSTKLKEGEYDVVSTGEGSIAVDLTQPCPVTSELSIEETLSGTDSTHGRQTEQRTVMHLTMTDQV